MKNLRYVCVQPQTLYYAWQVEVMINNFLKNGINPNNIDILVVKTNDFKGIELWNKLTNKYNNIRFFYYEDTRKSKNYVSSIRPNVLKQHFQEHTYLENEVIFYHDCDIVFTKPPNFDKFLEDDIWYLSDTNSYINYDYIISKGLDVYEKMCEIIKINPIIPKLMNSNSGGAQYILKNINSEFWEKIENNCEELFTKITELNDIKLKEDPKYHPLQIWCADMWALLWNGWKNGNETKIIEELDFSWATDYFEEWNKKPIYHNAGATCGCHGTFYKVLYVDMLPYGIEDNFDKNKNCYNYFLEIQQTAKNSCLWYK